MVVAALQGSSGVSSSSSSESSSSESSSSEDSSSEEYSDSLSSEDGLGTGASGMGVAEEETAGTVG